MGKLSKNVVIYFIGNTINRFMGIIVLLASTHILTNKEDIGFFTFVSNTTNILLTIFCLQIWMGIIRFVYDYMSIKGKLKIISTGYFIGFLGFLIYLVVLILYCINKKYTIGFFFQMAFLSFSYVFNQIVQFACRGLGKNKLFAISGVVGSFMQLITSLLFLFVFKLTSSGLILATSFSYLSQGIFIEIFLNSIKHIKFKYISFKVFKQMLKYSIPTTMNSIIYFFNQSAYTWLLKFYYDDSAIGIFTPAVRMMSLIGLFVMSFNFAFQEYSFLVNKTRKKSKIYSQIFNYFVRFISSSTIILLPATCIFFSFMISSSYAESKILIPILFLSSVFDAIQLFLSSILQAEKKVIFMFFSQLIGSITTITVMFLTNSLIGLQSAGLSMCVCFLVVSILRFIFIKLSINLKFNIKYVLHFLPVYLLTSLIFLNYNALVNILYEILAIFYFVICNKKLIIKILLKILK